MHISIYSVLRELPGLGQVLDLKIQPMTRWLQIMACNWLNFQVKYETLLDLRSEFDPLVLNPVAMYHKELPSHNPTTALMASGD
jgi:hypothetical protein